MSRSKDFWKELEEDHYNDLARNGEKIDRMLQKAERAFNNTEPGTSEETKAALEVDLLEDERGVINKKLDNEPW